MTAEIDAAVVDENVSVLVARTVPSVRRKTTVEIPACPFANTPKYVVDPFTLTEYVGEPAAAKVLPTVVESAVPLITPGPETIVAVTVSE